MVQRHDVVVVGGGAAGVAAAVGAAAAGADVALVERHGYLGGAAVASSVLTYCGFFDRSGEQVVAGVGQNFLDRLDAKNLYLTHVSQDSGNTIVLLDLETTKRVLDEMVVDAGVHLMLHADLFGAAVEGRHVQGIDVNHAGGHERVVAEAFVDCTGDGALLHAASASTTSLPVTGRQASTLVMRVGGVAEDGDLSRSSVAQAIHEYRRSAGVRLSRDHGALVRLPVSREIMVLIADEHVDMLDLAAATSAEIGARRAASHYFEALRSRLDGWQSSFLAATGPEIGVRESRRAVGRGSVTVDDVVHGRRLPDSVVARGGWPMEDHATPGRTAYTPVRDDGWFDIGYDATVSSSHNNLWSAGRLLSSEGQAFTSTRVMGTAFATGHASGVAAAQLVRGGHHDVAATRAELRRQGALL